MNHLILQKNSPTEAPQRTQAVVPTAPQAQESGGKFTTEPKSSSSLQDPSRALILASSPRVIICQVRRLLEFQLRGIYMTITT